jgi:RHS repeat-associated protein
VSDSTVAIYYADGLRVAKTDTWTNAHNYTWGPGGVLYDSNNSSTYTPGFAQNQGGTDRYLHSDWLGSTRYLSDSTGNSFPGMLRYDAFGGRSATNGTDGYYPSASQFAGDFGYQTEYASATEPGVGLQYLDQRYYDPGFGRFITSDPIGVAGGLNLYGYAGNDPVNGVDPSGLSSFRAWETDFLRGSVVVSDWAYRSRYGLGLTAGVAGAFLPGGGLVEAALLGGSFTAGFSASGNPAPLDVATDAAIGATGASEAAALIGQGSLAYQYQFGNFEAETAGVECGASTAAAPLPMVDLPSAARLAAEEAESHGAGAALGPDDEPIDAPINGQYPSWTTVKKRLFQKHFGSEETPRHPELDVPLEVHHRNGRAGPRPHREEGLQMVWPWEHADIDPHRYYNGPRPG